jgi:hypothetical protein
LCNPTDYHSSFGHFLTSTAPQSNDGAIWFVIMAAAADSNNQCEKELIILFLILLFKFNLNFYFFIF